MKQRPLRYAVAPAAMTIVGRASATAPAASDHPTRELVVWNRKSGAEMHPDRIC